ncbi:MAG TPA: YitT family protein [Chitinophagaceae bacterium]|jgi:uncharacterized membrane-anchored protein YitT (DUF2179 family)/predicted metal-dependent HD superfamily phosphohydrolase|nr:YitT family protein [Chitinophagaceae bacterium]
MKYEEVYSFLLAKLKKELPGNLTYHNAEHTMDVIQAVTRLASEEGIPDKEKKLLLTAALFHDSGFLEDYDNHEEVSCKLARTYLPEYDYSQEDIEHICSLVMVTKQDRIPSNIYEEILCDADLYYLGTGQYARNALQLYKELKSVGKISGKSEWKQKQIDFLTTHQYYTATAKKSLAAKSKENLAHLGQRKGNNHAVHPAYVGVQDFFLICLGILTAGFGLQGFLVPSHFVDGGVTGIALLLHSIYGLNLAGTTFVLNLPFIFASIFVVSRHFAVKTFFCVALLALCLLYFPYPTITSDKLLISVFGGFFLGVGSGLAMRAGCVTDGIEVLALYTWKKTSFTISEIILGLNIVIFAVAALHFGIETALYSILTYLAASKTIDYVVEGVEAYTGVTIISGHSEIIKSKLVNQLGRSITIYKGERGYLPGKFEISSDVDIIFTVITRLELRKLKNLVHEIDKNAFVFANTIKEASGGIIKRRNLH